MINRFPKFIVFFLIIVAYASASTIGGRLINGINAGTHHGFAVRIHSVENQQSQTAYLSTGVAITSTVVVTVAQAIKPYTIWYIFSGGIVSAQQDSQESRNGVPHPGYNPINLNNNIGVVILTTPVANFIPIALPGASIGSYQVFGYGVNAANQLPTVLQTIALSTITNDECATIYGSALVTNNNFCAIVAQADSRTANGDQGGPLIPLFLDTQVSGIISFWGRDATLPIVFERVHAYNDFLQNFV